MKRASYVISCALSLGLGVDSALADVITVNVTAHIQGIVDKSGVFPGLSSGQPLTATYSYDTDTPMERETPSGGGVYRPASRSASIKVFTGRYIFQSLETSFFQVTVMPHVPDAGHGTFYVDARDIQPLIPGAQGDGIELAFFGLNWPASNALPAGAPAMQNLSGAGATVIVKNYSTDSQLIASIDSITLASAP